MPSNVTIVILAAGLGTRMKSKKAKVLHKAGGMPLVEHVVRTALTAAAPDRVIVIVGHQAADVQAAVEKYRVRFATQTEQKGTGHALMVCGNAVSDRTGLLVVLYGDCPLLGPATLQRLFDTHRSSGAAATVLTTELAEPTGYGRVLTNANREITAIVEQKVATPEQRRITEINSGIYCFDSALLWRHLAEITPNPVSGEYYLTDIVELLTKSGHKVKPLLHANSTELLGINTRVELAGLDAEFRQRKTHELMLGGVTIQMPDTVTIDAQVEVGPDSIIEASAQLLGATVVGEDCVIGTGAIIKDSVLADAVRIAPYTIVLNSRIDARATIGPFARLRQDTHVEAGAHIGNFVELKKTRMGAGAKAGHLAYLGDSTVGEKTNVGAGAITCNYDGEKKHKTTVGSGVFIGSNCTLVAPVELGEGCYTAAGSVITHSVPKDALAVGRGRQTNKEDWARRRRERRIATSSAPEQ